MSFMSVYIYNENTHGRQEWEEWSEKDNQNILLQKEHPREEIVGGQKNVF